MTDAAMASAVMAYGAMADVVMAYLQELHDTAVVLFSCCGGTNAADNSADEHSAFTAHLIEELKSGRCAFPDANCGKGWSCVDVAES